LKYIFFDVDGTLLPFGQDMPQSTKEALKQAKEKGHKIFLSTGRSPAELNPRLRVIPFDGGIYAGGASAAAEGVKIYETFFSHSELEELYALGEKRGWKLLVQTTTGSFMKEEMKKELFELFIRCNGRVLEIDNLNVVDTLPYPENATKLIVLTPDNDVKQIREELIDRYDTVDNTMGVPLDACAELVQKGVSKATGLERILAFYGANRADSIAFGDGANDIEIIEEAGIGVAMGNASAELKSKADLVTSDILEDGIYKALKKLGVI